MSEQQANAGEAAEEGREIMRVVFTEKPNGNISVSTHFSDGVPVGEMFVLVGRAIGGLIMTAEKIGRAKGMSEEQIHEAIFGDVKVEMKK